MALELEHSGGKLPVMRRLRARPTIVEARILGQRAESFIGEVAKDRQRRFGIVALIRCSSLDTLSDLPAP